jgi:hypothetical protein
MTKSSHPHIVAVTENGRVDQTIHENQTIETWEMYGRIGIGFN